MVVQEWPRGIRVKQSQGKQIGGGTRGRVVDLSTGSRANMAWVYVQGPWRSMLTLTYHESFPDGRTSKAQLNTWLQHLRQRGIKYLWVLEWQGRGFPHYHVWMDAEFRDCPLWEDESDGKSWRPLMMHWLNITKQNVNQKTIDFALHQKTYCPWEVRAGNNYASKYASKQDQKGLPMGVDSYGRWWGASVGINKPIRQIEIPEFSDIPEEKDNLTKTVKFKRDAKRALEHWSTHPPKKRRTLSGFSAVLRENRKNDICRILSNHFPNPFDKKCQNQYARRAASLRANDDKIYNYLIPKIEKTRDVFDAERSVQLLEGLANDVENFSRLRIFGIVPVGKLKLQDATRAVLEFPFDDVGRMSIDSGDADGLAIVITEIVFGSSLEICLPCVEDLDLCHTFTLHDIGFDSNESAGLPTRL